MQSFERVLFEMPLSPIAWTRSFSRRGRPIASVDGFNARTRSWRGPAAEKSGPKWRAAQRRPEGLYPRQTMAFVGLDKLEHVENVKACI